MPGRRWHPARACLSSTRPVAAVTDPNPVHPVPVDAEVHRYFHNDGTCRACPEDHGYPSCRGHHPFCAVLLWAFGSRLWGGLFPGGELWKRKEKNCNCRFRLVWNLECVFEVSSLGYSKRKQGWQWLNNLTFQGEKRVLFLIKVGAWFNFSVLWIILPKNSSDLIDDYFSGWPL